MKPASWNAVWVTTEGPPWLRQVTAPNVADQLTGSVLADKAYHGEN